MRAVLYCRVSTVEQTLNLSLPTQEKACREYAGRHGYAVDRVFVDRGESAKSTDRPEFQAMLAHCRAQKGKLQAVIVYGLSRFSRNNADHHAIAALLRGYGIALRSVTEPIDDSPAGRFMEAIIAGMAQFDNDLRSDRTKVGMRAATERGRWAWQAPIGYRTGSRAAGEPSLVPVPDLAEAIRDAFVNLAQSDRSVTDLCAELHARGVRGRSGRPIAIQTVHRLLRNPAYCGRLVSAGLGVDRAGDWTPLVDASLWHRAQLRLRESEPDATARTTAHPDFPLRRFLYCATCDRPMTGGWSTGRSKRYAYYQCRRQCHAAPTRTVEDAYRRYLATMLPDAEYLELVRRDVLKEWRDIADTRQRERTGLEATATRIRSQIRLLEDAYIFEKAIDKHTFETRRDDCREQLARTESALAAHVVDLLQVEATLADAEYAIANALALWDRAASTDRRQRLQWLLFPDGMVWTGSEVLNRGSRCACYEIQPIGDRKSQWASPACAVLNHLPDFGEAWRAFLAA